MAQTVTLQALHELAGQLMAGIEELMANPPQDAASPKGRAPAPKTSALDASKADAPRTPKSAASATDATGKKTPVKKIPTAAELKSMDFNDVRSLAAELGVFAGGKRSEIETNILALAADNAKNTPTKPLPKPKANVPTQEDKIRAELEDYSDKEIAEMLKEAKLSSRGGRNALIDRVIVAVEDGTIEWSDPIRNEGAGDDSASDDDTFDDDTSDDKNTFDVYEEFPRFEANNLASAHLTNERRAKLEAMDRVLQKEGVGETEEGIDEFLVGYFGKEIDTEAYTAEQKVVIYLEALKLFVNDEGNETDTGEAYYLNDALYCCGALLPKSGKCVGCETEYDIG